MHVMHYLSWRTVGAKDGWPESFWLQALVRTHRQRGRKGTHGAVCRRSGRMWWSKLIKLYRTFMAVCISKTNVRAQHSNLALLFSFCFEYQTKARRAGF
jgi:hypothetical protein